MSPGRLRSFRSAFEQGVEQPLNRDAIGLLRVRANITGFYIAHVLSAIDVNMMRQEARRVVIYADSAQSRELCEELFAGCGWGVVVAATAQEARKLSRKQGAVALSVGEGGLAILTGSETVEGSRLDLLAALLELRTGAKEIFCDALAPEAIEEMAARYDASVLRKHTQKLVRGIDRGSLLFFVKTDPYAAAVLLCEKVAALDTSITDLANELPPLVLHERSIACAWKDIGRIFRTIAEEQAGANVERLEGLRIKNKNGYVHLLPGNDGRRMRVISGAFSEEYAESLADLYVRRANCICESKDTKA